MFYSWKFNFESSSWRSSVQTVFKVSYSSFRKTAAHPGDVGLALPPLHPPCPPKSATPSACTWTTSCVLTESGTPFSSRTRTSQPGRRCATTGDLSTYRRILNGQSLRLMLGIQWRSLLFSCSPSPTPATFGMSKFLENMGSCSSISSISTLLVCIHSCEHERTCNVLQWREN